MRFFEEIIKNHVLWASIISWGISQVFKIITNLLIDKKFDPGRIFGDGGMPSGHSATVMCLAIMCGWYAGFNSITFAVSMILAVIVMHDAMGVRREAGKQAASIKELAEAVNNAFLGENKEIRTENLKVLVGHTPLQVALGALTGFTVALIYILILG